MLPTLIEILTEASRNTEEILGWGCPIPSFGDVSKSAVATLGLNPSNREFTDAKGDELIGSQRRFHTLQSLGIGSWEEVHYKHLELISNNCSNYFKINPYDNWFRDLNNIISGTKTSYYGSANACHLDLIPFATEVKWVNLTRNKRNYLLGISASVLGKILKKSKIGVLILNGKTVVQNLEFISGKKLAISEKTEWMLPRKNGKGVKGFSYKGIINEVCGIKLNRDIMVLGYNHNIQSSYGVTTSVKNSIKNWITSETSQEYN
ncbi:MAG: hypothetical protein D8M58_21565 [Calditrichaeota bacterium]|nr:MAG: hypothetical protein DWQ03_17030 [Calditrichota bacterium]MBL1208003.1 hypothetical protein [Calditrichota bacterium]NOG47839.1 hypothetical protein [Calditrichota bacterium]